MTACGQEGGGTGIDSAAEAAGGGAARAASTPAKTSAVTSALGQRSGSESSVAMVCYVSILCWVLVRSRWFSER